MTTYNTGNPVGSTDARDLYDNAQNLDIAVNSAESTFTDRLGKVRPTLASATDPSGFAQTALDAKAAAEAARDAAFVNASVYADTPAGLAATTNGQQFQVVSGDTIIRYKNNAGVAAEVARYPSGGVVQVLDFYNGVNLEDLTELVFGATNYTSNNGGGGYFWSNHPPLAKESILTEFKLNLAAGGTVRVLVVNSSRVVVNARTLTLTSGVNTVPFDLVVPAGAQVFYDVSGGASFYYNGSGGSSYFFSPASYSGNVGDTVDANTQNTVALSAVFKFRTVEKTVRANLADLNAAETTTKTQAFLSGIDQLEFGAEYTSGASSYTGMTTGVDYSWSPDLSGLSADSYLTDIEVGTSGAGTGRVIVVGSESVVLSVTQVSIPQDGINKITLATPIFVPVGGRTFFQTTTSILRYDNPGSGDNNRNIAGATYATGQVVTIGSNNPTRIAIKLFYKPVIAAKLTETVESLQEQVGLLLADAVSETRATQAPTTFWPAPDAPNIAFLQVGLDAGVELPVGSIINKISGDIGARTGAAKFYFQIAKRPSTGTGKYDRAVSGPMLQTVVKTPAELGLTINAAGVQYFEVEIDPITVEAGQTYFAFVSCVNSAGASVGFALGELMGLPSESRLHRRGYYSSSAFDYAGASALPDTYASSFGVQYLKGAANSSSVSAVDATTTSDTITAANAIVAGTSVTLSGTLTRNGVPSPISGSQTLVLTTGSNIRYDVIYYDAEAATFGTVTGSNRTIDPSEAIPAIGDPKRIPLLHCRVTSSSITAVPVWALESKEVRTLSEAMESERRRSRLCLPKTLAKIRKGAALKVASMGDSILAIQDSSLGTPSSATPNGAGRDRTYYFLESIASDIVGAYPLYTAVQLGRADDGAGAVHIAQSYVWQFVMALRATGQTVSYDNFAIGGQATSGAVDAGGNPTAWLTNVINLAPDVVVLNFGMNERGNTSTETRMVQIINHLKTAGIEVIVNGCPRPAGSISGWEFTNRALERAAKYTGVAFVSMLNLYDERFIGAIGCASDDVSCANRINHPGLREHQRIGQEYIKLLMGAA